MRTRMFFHAGLLLVATSLAACSTTSSPVVSAPTPAVAAATVHAPAAASQPAPGPNAPLKQSGPFPAPSTAAPPAGAWLPEPLTQEGKTRRAAADMALMRGESLRLGYDNAGLLQDEVRKGQYAVVEQQLDAILALSLKDPQFEFVEQDAANFAEGKNPIQPLEKSALDAWVKARPKSPWAHYSVGLRWSSQAWMDRGDGWASDISDEQMQKMHADEVQARKEIRKAIAVNPKIGISWLTLMNIDSTDGSFEAVTGDYSAASKARPASFLVPDQYEVALEPRWFGTYEMMDALAHSKLSQLDLNPRFWTLQGFSAADQGCAACNNYDWGVSLRRYSSALVYGDMPSWLERAGDAATHLHRYALAHAFYDRAKRYKADSFDLVIETDMMDALCNPTADPRKLAILEQEGPQYSQVPKMDYPMQPDSCVYYQAELPWGDEPIPAPGYIPPYSIRNEMMKAANKKKPK